VVEYAVVIIGGLLVTLGIVYQSSVGGPGEGSSTADQIVAGVALALGGSVLGAGINSVVVRRYEFDILREINDTISRSLQARFVSENSDLAIYRRDWHHYYVTEIEGNSHWWYESCSFGRNFTVGSISERTELRDSAGYTHAYITEVGVRGQRLVLLETREDGVEAGAVEVFPLPRGFQNLHTGIVCLETWDGSHAISKCILSKNPMVEVDREGIVPAEHSQALDQAWRDNFSRHTRVII
jgi:hypothetical protein